MTQGLPDDSRRLDRIRNAARILEAEAVTYLWPFDQRRELCSGEPGPCPDDAYDAARHAFERRMEQRAERATYEGPLVWDLPSPNLAFVNSTNQLAALSTTIEALRKRSGCDVVAEGETVAHARTYGADDILRYRCRGARHALDFARAHPALLREIADRTASAKPSALFDVIYSIFGAIALLEASRPLVLLVSNDHLMSQRTLIVTARLMGAQTAYIQHAAVSTLFPRLDVDIAFLDGASAAETYARCADNGPAFSTVPTEPLVILSGQKKPLSASDPAASVVGVACNLLDDIDALISVVRDLVAASHQVRLRWHPRQEPDQIGKIAAAFEACSGTVTFSDPSKEPVNEFLRGVHAVVAGDSSVLLEAAIAGCKPIYLRTSDRAERDYYGFARQGLARPAETVEGILEVLYQDGPKAGAIRHFSATFGTAWQGFEGELTAAVLERLATGSTILDLVQPCKGMFPLSFAPRAVAKFELQATRLSAMS